MKLRLFFLTSLIVFLASTHHLMGMSLGRVGDPYYENDILWQKVEYDNYDSGFIAAMPGSPISGITEDGFVYTASQYKDAFYLVYTSLKLRYSPPNSEKEFLAQVKELFNNSATVSSVPPTQKRVKYIADVCFVNENKIARVYCSRNCLYWAVVNDGDL